jgi:hypothetical protein
MNQASPSLSNLRLVPNLLREDYPPIFPRLSAMELYDIHRRNSNLPISFNPSDYQGLTAQQQSEYRQRLFWGDRSVSLDDEDRWVAWLELFARSALPCLRDTGRELDEEQLFELLYVAAELGRSRSPQVGQARDAVGLLCGVLKADRFGYTDEQIQGRLRQLLGDETYRLEV